MNESVSVIVVNHNGMEFLEPCFESLSRLNAGGFSLELILVDNLSTDHSTDIIQKRYPQVKIVNNDVNNFAGALNLGFENAGGNYIAFLNNDTVVDRKWLDGLLKVAREDGRIGGVQSKILFSDGKILNSAGAQEVDDFYFRDIGFGEADAGQYGEKAERDYLSGGSVLYRKTCLEDVGPFDEDYVMFFEDIDYSIRCRDRGWRLFYSPQSIVYHKYHGSASVELCEYLCSRNRLMLLAKRFPERFAGAIRTSHTFQNGHYDRLYWDILHGAKKLIECHDARTVRPVLEDLKQTLANIYGTRAACVFFRHLEAALGLRKIRVGIYDHAFHFPGGGQRYVAKAAEILQDRYDVTYLASKDASLEQYQEWFGIDLSRCRLKIIKLPFYENIGGMFIDEAHANASAVNYFEPIGRESANYDIFLNANMLSRVEPESPLSIFMCHFPDQEIGRHFSVHRYDYVIANSEYTSFWIKKKWEIQPTLTLYPPVDMYDPESRWDQKEKIILSVARFELGGSKKQLEMIRAFYELSRDHAEIEQEWMLVLAGGTHEGNPYYLKIIKEINRLQPKNIVLRPNLTNREIRELYRRASVFWHACGLDETNPHLIEHFGMATVEAMQNYCVPIVIDGGGQREIVEHGKNGFRFSGAKQLKDHTLSVIRDDDLRKNLACNAYERSHEFNVEMFQARLSAFMKNVEIRLKGGISIEP